MKPMLVQTVMMFSQTGQINPQYYKLVDELEELKRRVKKLDGKTVIFVHKVPSVASSSMIVSEVEVDDAVFQAMFLKPEAFSKNVNNGRTLPDKLTSITGSLNRAIAKKQMQPKRRVLRTRKDFLEFYQNQFNFFNPSKTGKMGSFLNKTMTRDLTRGR